MRAKCDFKCPAGGGIFFVVVSPFAASARHCAPPLRSARHFCNRLFPATICAFVNSFRWLFFQGEPNQRVGKQLFADVTVWRNALAITRAAIGRDARISLRGGYDGCIVSGFEPRKLLFKAIFVHNIVKWYFRLWFLFPVCWKVVV